MSIHFVFVHGAGHGGWCWYKLSSLLQEAGHKVTCIDLKGAGIDLTDPNTISSSDEYNAPLYTFLSKLPPNEKVILVGHSIGGGSVTAAMCLFPSRVSMAVYLAAAMVKPGSLAPQKIRQIYLGGLEEDADIWDYTFANGPDNPPTSVIMKKKYRRQKYYNQSPFEDYTLASSLLRPAPVMAFEGMADLPASPQIDNIPRVYMRTAKDQLFSQSKQELMVSLWPPSQLFVLEESDHSAFFSVPETVFACLIQAATSV